MSDIIEVIQLAGYPTKFPVLLVPVRIIYWIKQLSLFYIYFRWISEKCLGSPTEYCEDYLMWRISYRYFDHVSGIKTIEM